jgi:2'-5' RNA ligase
MWIGSHKGGVKEMTLLVLAYPELEPADRAWIERIRAEHDPRHIAVAAHVTLVFPVAGMDPDTLIADVARQASGVAPIPFVLRSALPFKDVTGRGTDVFLVPDEGFGALVRLHDRLYAGALASALRLDIPSIPHITIGRSDDPTLCKRLADDLNAQPFAIHGRVTALDVVLRAEQAVRTIARLPLTRP